MSDRRRALWWLKRDFRLADNPALSGALDGGGPVVAVFIAEPSLLHAAETSPFHVNAWLNAANDLRGRLHAGGGELLVLHGEAVATLAELYRRWPFSTLHSHQETGTGLTFERDKAVARWCRQRGVTWREAMQSAVFRPLRDRDGRQKLWSAWMQTPALPPPSRSALAALALPDELKPLALHPRKKLRLGDYGLTLRPKILDALQPVSETAAQQTLTSFLDRRGLCYSGGISSPNTAFECGSRLSTHLAWGTLSGRLAYQTTQRRIDELKRSEHPDAGRWRRSLRSFLSRLHWRDHFTQRLESEVEMELRPLNAAFDALRVDDDPEHLEAWVDGRSGFPLVDACMRCLHGTGFINFRMRAMITSLACHVLHLDWRSIMHPQGRLYADYDPGIHISQLQMQAGVVGINTLRIYNPAKQIVDHDPQTRFVKTWVPELRRCSAERIIAHQSGSRPVNGYPPPRVDWAAAGKRYRELYWAARRQPGARAATEAVLAKHGSRKPPAARKAKADRVARGG